MNRRRFLRTMALAAAMGTASRPAGPEPARAADAGPAPAQPSASPSAADKLPFLKGGDVSLVQRIEELGGIYKEDGKAKDLLALFKDHGCNAMRLRLFHSPNGKGPVVNSLEYTLKLAERIKAAGLRLILDLHYSDTWADPTHQAKPKVWQDLAPDRLEAEVLAYTRQVVAAHKSRGATPDIVLIGNEITPGMLWDTGRVGGKFDTPAQWQALAGLVRSGIRGVQAAAGAGETVRTMIHLDRGGDAAGTRWFFDRLVAERVEFDLIGLSYYPWWHGPLDGLRANLAATARRYSKDILLVETGSPWTTLSADGKPNAFAADSERAKLPHPPTPAGQKAFLAEVIRIVRETPEGRGKGVIYWAPEWIAVRGLPSRWDHIALFDRGASALAAIAAFAEQSI